MSTKKWIVLILGLLGAAAMSEASASNCYVKCPTHDKASLQVNRELIESYGGRIIHEFPATGEFICWMAPLQFDLLVQEQELTGQHQVRNVTVGSPGATASIGEFCWMRFQSDEPEPPPDRLQAFAICGTGQLESAERERWLSLQPLTDRSISRDQMFNTNYLVGKTAVCIVLPEYAGGTEIWTTGEEDAAIASVVTACEHLSEMAYERNIDVSWEYEVHRSVPVTEEPIDHKRPSFDVVGLSWDFGWMDDALQHLGFGSGWSGLFGNGNRLRQQYETDWGLTFFVVKNSTEPGFPGGAVGYVQQYWPPGTIVESFRTPFGVSTLYPGGYSSYWSQFVIAHEILHTFGAADEYEGAWDCGGGFMGFPDPCLHGHGFLCHNNTNCELCIGSGQDCIMRGSIEYGYQMCSHTLRHIGWSDSDGDGHPDAIDLNNGKWQVFHQMNPGDIVRVFTLGGDLVRNICATPTKIQTSQSGNILYYDCLNYQSQEIAIALYYYTVNNGEPQTFVPNVAEPGWTPVVTNVAYSPTDQTLSWDLETSMCYLELEIWTVDPCTGDSVMVGKPQWNQFHLITEEVGRKTEFVGNLACDECLARFRTWRPDGMNGPQVEFVYTSGNYPDDCDGIPANWDICPFTYNPEQDSAALREWSAVFEETDGFYTVEAVQPMFDGNYLVAGQVETWALGCYYHLWKVDACGSIVWDRPCCGPWLKSSVVSDPGGHAQTSPDERGYWFNHPIIEPTADSGFIVLTNEEGFTLVKLDKYGNQEWYWFIGWWGIFGFSVHQTSNGGYVIAMQGDDPPKPSVLWFDANGSILRQMSIGETWYYPDGMDARETSDGGTICVTDWPVGGANGTDIRVVKYDAAYNVEWDHTFGGTDENTPMTVLEVPGTGYAIAGIVISPGVSYHQRLMMINSTGTQLLWDSVYSSPSWEGLACAITTDDGGYLLAGSTLDSGSGGVDFYVRKVDDNGAEQWSQTFDGLDNEVANSIVSTDDGGFIVGGPSWSGSGLGNLGGLVVKAMPPTCCVGIRGNVDGDPDDQIDISDLVTLTNYMFSQGPEPPCWEEANINGLGPDDESGIDISDLTYLVDYMFNDGPEPPPCP